MFGSIGGAQGVGGPLHNSIGGEDFIRHIGNDKLIYDFKEGSGTTVHDKSHCGNDGTFGAGAAVPTWKRNSLYFDGGDYVDLTGITHGISTGAFSFVINVSDWNADAMILYQSSQNIPIQNTSDKIRFFISGHRYVSLAGLSTTSPVFAIITRDGSGNLECYLNNKIQKQAQTDAGTIAYAGSAAVSMGSNTAHDDFFLLGTMYSFRILNKGLSGIECQQEYLVNKFSN